MLEKDPIGNDLRKEIRERPQPEDPTCIFCGESDPAAIEQHHPAGRAHAEDITVPCCKGHHATSTERQRMVGADLRPAPSIVEKILNALRSLGEFFLRLGEQFLEWSEGLAQHARLLDMLLPDWREA